MTDDKDPLRNVAAEDLQAKPTTNWEDLRAQAAKLGITLSELQQQQRLQKLKQKAKERHR